MKEKLIQLLRQFPKNRVLVIGDIMLDRFITGSVNRISPEAPVPIFKMDEMKKMLGGAGNVVSNLTALGCLPHFIGGIGQDEYGVVLSNFLDGMNATYSLLKTPNTPTIVKTRLISKNNHLLRLDQETTLHLSPDEQQTLLTDVATILPQMDVVLLSDYGKGLLTPHFTQSVIELCHQANKAVFVDPKGNDYRKYRGADLIKPNLKELELATQTTLSLNEPDFIQKIAAAARQMLNQNDIKQAIITLSEKGMLYVSRDTDTELYHLPTFAREVFDVSGAGDTSFATLGLAIASGATMTQAMELGNLASGVVVGKLGTATVSQTELENAIKNRYADQQETENSLDKIVDIETACQRVEQVRQSGKKIGFTNGVFDLLHRGHLHSLRQARAECDYLVVAVNRDISVQRYKGPNRPIHDEQTRSEIVAALEMVDLVILFDKIGDDNTATPLVRLLKPDVIAKEGYTLDKWPEAQYVSSYGGKVVFIKRLEGYSTTHLLEKMKVE